MRYTVTSTGQLPPLLQIVLYAAGLVVVAAGLRAAAPAVNLVPVSFLLAMTMYPVSYLLTERGMKRGLAVLLTVSGAGRAGAPFAVLFVANLVADNVVKPKVMGGGLGLSPLVIVLSFMLWAYVLGAMGAVLAIPLTIVIHKTLPVLVGRPSDRGGWPAT